MNRYIRRTSFVAIFMVFFTFLFAPVAVYAQSGSVILWNKLDGGTGGSPSEIGPQLNYYDPNVDGGIAGFDCDVIGNVQFVPGKFGSAATLGPGGYYSTACVHALILRNVNTVLNPERGTIAVWYKEKVRPVPYKQDFYRIFDGPTWGFNSPVSLFVCDPPCDVGQSNRLLFNIVFGGQQNTAATADFVPNLNEWVHIAAVWDRTGIDRTSDTVRLYVNGGKVAAIQSNSWGTGFNGNHADIAGGNDFMDNKFELDNLVIYDYAKTDFSDRFNENPIGHAFSTFTPRAKMKLGPETKDDSLTLTSYFKLAADSNGIDPPTEVVIIRLGTFFVSVPIGSFQPNGKGFEYVNQAEHYGIWIQPQYDYGDHASEMKWPHQKPTGAYQITVRAYVLDLENTTLAPTVQVTIDDDSGQAKLDAGRAFLARGENGKHWLSDDREGDNR